MARESGLVTYFWLRQVHTVTGVFLAFAFLFIFLIPYSTIFAGPSSYNLFAAIYSKIPLIDIFEFTFILIPLVFHIVVGLKIVYTAEFNILTYSYYRNWMYAFQRIAGIILIPFILYHIYETRIIFAFTGKYADFNYIHKLLAPTWVKVFYITGVVCAAFYVCNGFAAALMKWGVTVSRRAQDVLSMTMWVVTLILSLWGIRIVLAF